MESLLGQDPSSEHFFEEIVPVLPYQKSDHETNILFPGHKQSRSAVLSDVGPLR